MSESAAHGVTKAFDIRNQSNESFMLSREGGCNDGDSSRTKATGCCFRYALLT